MDQFALFYKVKYTFGYIAGNVDSYLPHRFSDKGVEAAGFKSRRFLLRTGHRQVGGKMPPPSGCGHCYECTPKEL
jgi:hypothetical protein